jgi:peptide/nickel transport system permease protein
MKDAMANSLRLGLTASFVGISIGLMLGIFAALRPGSMRDTAVNTGAFVGFSIPPYVSAMPAAIKYAAGIPYIWRC